MLKNQILFFTSIFISLFTLAQAPEAMNYQAVIRDASGNIVANQSVGIRIDILQGTANGISIYQETFTSNTSSYGLVALQLGTGSVVRGSFNTIDWGNDTYFVETAVDINGGSAYTVISTNQFVSVPYALYAKSSGSVDTDFDVNPNNELQVLSFSSTGDTLFLDRGGYLIIPGLSGANTINNPNYWWYFGTSLKDSLTSNDIILLNAEGPSDSDPASKSVGFPGAGYWYICFPDSWGNIQEWSLGGIIISSAMSSPYTNIDGNFRYAKVNNVPLNDGSGGTTTYRVYRSEHIQGGTANSLFYLIVNI